MKKYLMFLMLFTLLFTSCKEIILPKISLDDSEYTLTAAGVVQTIPIDINVSWKAVSSASWCKVSPTSGDATVREITVTLEANDTGKERSCVVTVTAAEVLTKDIVINQPTIDLDGVGD